MNLLLMLAGLVTVCLTLGRKGGGGAVIMTRQRAAIHGHFMGHEMQPEKLVKAAELFDREGLTSQANQLREKARTIGPQMKAAIDLADRARSGDQNAMAMIAACREQAKKGNIRAIVTCKCIETYCIANPPKQARDDSSQGMAEVS
jgi:hypothetical protein